MVEYRCDVCDYETKKKTDFTKHCETNKHKKKLEKRKKDKKIKKILIIGKNNGENEEECIVSNDNICKFCGRSYRRLDGLMRHESKCSTKIIHEKDKENNKREKDHKNAKRTIKRYKKTVKEHKETIEKQKKTIEKQEEIIERQKKEYEKLKKKYEKIRDTKQENTE